MGEFKKPGVKKNIVKLDLATCLRLQQAYYITFSDCRYIHSLHNDDDSTMLFNLIGLS